MMYINKRTFRIPEFSHPSTTGQNSVTYVITHNLEADITNSIIMRDNGVFWTSMGSIERDRNSGNHFDHAWEPTVGNGGNAGNLRIFRIGGTTNVKGLIRTID